MAEQNEQWLLGGRCDLCRRNKYCNKPCTANKRHADMLTRALVKSVLCDMTGHAMDKHMCDAVDTTMSMRKFL